MEIEDTKWIYKLRKPALQSKLKEHRLSTTGKIDTLRERLVSHLTSKTITNQNRMEENSTKEEKPKSAPAEVMDKVRKWGIYYDGGKDVFGYLERLDEMTTGYNIDKNDLLLALPELLRGKALLWYRNNREDWRTWADFVESLKGYFLPPQYELKLEEEFRTRTQGQNEVIREYITAMQTLGRRSGSFTSNQQLDRIYTNLKPEYKLYIRRNEFKTINELQRLGEEYEIIKQDQRSFKPPPAAGRTYIPETAYKGQETQRITPMTFAIIHPEYNMRECCWKCGEKGHSRFQCRKPPRLFCSRCGNTGTLSKNCNCRGNDRGTGQMKGLSGPNSVKPSRRN